MNINKTRLTAFALLATAITAAQAQGDDRQARVWAASCAACHGTDGRTLGQVPTLAGRNADELLQRAAGVQEQPAPGGHGDAPARQGLHRRRAASHCACVRRAACAEGAAT
jgi:cytochrome c553